MCCYIDWAAWYLCDKLIRVSVCSKAESHLRSVRLKLDSGERIVGIRFPEMLIPMVEKTLEEQKLIETVRLSQAVSMLKESYLIYIYLLIAKIDLYFCN